MARVAPVAPTQETRLLSWRAFNWGSRGPHFEVLPGVYVAAIYIPKCVQGTLFAMNTGTGQQLLHIFDFEAPAAPVTAADCQAVDNLLITWWVNTYRHLCATNVLAVRAVAVGRDQVEGATWEIGMSTAGDRAGTPNPSEVTLAVKMAGNNIGRSRRGRKFLYPAVNTDLVAGGVDQFTTSYVNAAVAAVDGLRTAATTAGYPMKVASNVRTALYTISHVVVVDLLQDSQRRRSAGRGR